MKGLHYFNHLACSLVGNHRFDTPADHLVFSSSEQTSQSFPLLSVSAATVLAQAHHLLHCSGLPLLYLLLLLSAKLCFANQTPSFFCVQPPPWLLPDLRMKPGHRVTGQRAPWRPARVGFCSTNLRDLHELDCVGLEAVGLRVINGSCSQPVGSACTSPFTV